jgi:hypothetical protein
MSSLLSDSLSSTCVTYFPYALVPLLLFLPVHGSSRLEGFRFIYYYLTKYYLFNLNAGALSQGGVKGKEKEKGEDIVVLIYHILQGLLTIKIAW